MAVARAGAMGARARDLPPPSRRPVREHLASVGAVPVTGWQIRPFETLDELRACVELQEETWGPGFTEKVPVSLLKVSQRLGGVAAGAWDESGRLLGFVFGMTGIEDGRPVHWSDMLAVRPEFRDVGLGWRLKAYQRRVLLERGVRSCYWTFDPLESRNAYLNFTKLGAVVREYVVDMYGDSDSPLHRGLGTDRFVALWKLDSQRVESRLVGRTPPLSLVQFAGLPRAFGVEGGLEVPVPAPAPPPDAGDPARFLVPIPSRIQDLKLRDPDAALAWREATRAVFARTVGRGYQVVELIREGLLSYYVVERVKSAPKHAEQGAVRDRTR